MRIYRFQSIYPPEGPFPVQGISMLFKMITAEGIAHHSYIVGSEGKAAVIDPRRDCAIYGKIADEAGMDITHIFETHRNEDYCSGAPQLAAQCGAAICHGSALPFRYGVPVHDGDEIATGSLKLSVIETPGHTEESISIVLTEREVSENPFMVFTGDTLFAGDIARTDLFGRERDAEMARKIFDSITQKILPLGDGVVVCPAHGAGSVCGSAIRDFPFTTIGYERKTNRLLNLDREEFIRERVRERPYTPPYFRRMEECNTRGVPVLPCFPGLIRLSVSRTRELVDSGAQVLDIRAPTSFASGHIAGSLSVWRDLVPTLTGWYFDYRRPIVIVDDGPVNPDPVVRRLMRLGYDNLAGFLSGGFPSWYRNAEETESFAACSVQELRERLQSESPFVLDVRDRRNFQSEGRIAGAYNIYVGELPQHLDEIPRDRPLVVTCDAGFKSSLAASWLARNGYTRITNLLGGMQAWARAGFPLQS